MTTPVPSPPERNDDSVLRRLESMEESLAFGERQSERLAALVADLSSQVHELTRRVSRSEAALESLRKSAQSESGDQSPDSSASAE